MAQGAEKIVKLDRNLDDLVRENANLEAEISKLKEQNTSLQRELEIAQLETGSFKRDIEFQAGYNAFLTEFLYSDLNFDSIRDVILRYAWKLVDCSYVYLNNAKGEEIGHFGEEEEVESRKEVIPFVYEGENYGSIVFGYNRGKDRNEEGLEFFIEKIAPVIGKKMHIFEDYSIARRLSEVDDLTQLKNRRLLRQKIKDLKDQGRQYSVALLDIDHFKKFNDSHGHSVGDQVLRYISSKMKSNLGRKVLIARYGGEELVAIMPDTDIDSAYDMIETLRKYLEENPAYHGDIGNLGVTFTAGVAENDGDLINVFNDFDIKLPKSDQAMYFGKQAGRNVVVKYIEKEDSAYYMWKNQEGASQVKEVE